MLNMNNKLKTFGFLQFGEKVCMKAFPIANHHHCFRQHPLTCLLLLSGQF